VRRTRDNKGARRRWDSPPRRQALGDQNVMAKIWIARAYATEGEIRNAMRGVRDYVEAWSSDRAAMPPR
jgi:hypothetical protein